MIVVDDGSKDDSVQRVQAIKDERLLLVQQPNGGVSSARNKGISLATGELVCFLDADDWYQPNYLETMVTLAQRYPDRSFFAADDKLVNPDILGSKNFGRCQICRRLRLLITSITVGVQHTLFQY